MICSRACKLCQQRAQLDPDRHVLEGEFIAFYAGAGAKLQYLRWATPGELGRQPVSAEEAYMRFLETLE